MLYLYGSGSYINDRKILKVGYTSDIETRKQQYLLHNPLGQFLDAREGDKILEEKLHLRLVDFKVEFLDEWFYDEPGVKEIFALCVEEIDKWLWDNRLDVFYPFPTPGSIKRQIQEELGRKYREPLEGTKII